MPCQHQLGRALNRYEGPVVAGGRVILYRLVLFLMAFVYDAIDQDIGNTLRELNPGPHYKRNHHQWLETFGRQTVNDHVQRVIAVMKLCNDMKDFRAKFERVFNKGPFQESFIFMQEDVS